MLNEPSFMELMIMLDEALLHSKYIHVFTSFYTYLHMTSITGPMISHLLQALSIFPLLLVNGDRGKHFNSIQV